MLCGTLTACSDLEDRSFSDYERDIDDLEDEATALDPTDPADLPDEGSAEYNGVMGLRVDEGDSPAELLAGDLELDVSFGDGAVTGGVTDIVDGNDDEYDGILEIHESYFNRDADPDREHTYGASMTGSVTDPNGEEWEVDADLDGNFLGSDWSHTDGEVSGLLCATPLNCRDLDGRYTAER